MLNYIKKLINNNNKTNTDNINSLLDSNYKRFEYLSNSISKKKNEILESNDTIGSYYKNKIILPKNINITSKKDINLKCFIYKILFSTISNNKDYYLPQKNIKLDYLLLASLLTVKTINKTIKKKYPQFKTLIKKIHPIIIKQRNEHLIFQSNLLELVLKKIMYEKNKIYINLTNNEKIIIYEIENITNIKKKLLKKKINIIYDKLINLKGYYENINLNILWGYLYHRKINKESKEIKNILTNNKNNNKNNETIINNNTIKHTTKTKNNKYKNNLSLIFDYKKTIDNYKKSNKDTDKKNIEEHTEILKSLDISNTIKSNDITNSIIKNKILNDITVSNIKNKKMEFKKYPYKEWDINVKKYKNNWCNIFVKNYNNSNTENQNFITNIIKIYKNDIKKISEKISLITHEKIWKKKQLNGEDIDFDTIIENYKEIKNNTFNKIYKFKKKSIKNIKLIILFDSSLSTDGYINEKKIIDFIKELTIILTYSFKNEIEHMISTFYSNTRHDCTYKIIKNLKEKNIKTNINNIHANGYTRVGPALRHSIKELKNIKGKKKIILLLTDGNPTDYDEYEGPYGIKDIEMAKKEAKKLNISIKCIIAHPTPNKEFINIFKNDNLKLNTYTCKKLIMFLKKILTE